MIDRYTEESVKDIGRTKTQVLRAIKRYDIANQRCSTITSADIIAFANQLVSKVTPQTVANYLSHLAAVFAIARPAWGYQLNQNAMKDAFVVAKRLGITDQEPRARSASNDGRVGQVNDAFRRAAKAPPVIGSHAKDHGFRDFFDASVGGNYAPPLDRP